MISNTVSTNNAKLHEPTQEHMQEYNDKDGYLKLLIKEVISKGFDKNLYLPHDDEKNDYSILKVVDYKLSHPYQNEIIPNFLQIPHLQHVVIILSPFFDPMRFPISNE